MNKQKNIYVVSYLLVIMLFGVMYSYGQTTKLNAITFATNQPSFSAGEDATICNNREFTTQGVAIPCIISMWQSSGDGTFENSNNLITVYSPGIQDITNGIVTLKLIIFPLGGGGNELIYDEMILSIYDCNAVNNF